MRGVPPAPVTITAPRSGLEYARSTGAVATGAGVSAPNQLGVSMSQPLTPNQGYYNIPTLEADVGDKAFTEGEKDLKKGVPSRSGPITYAGFGDQYFLSVFLPADPKVGTLAMAYSGDEAIARTRGVAHATFG